MDLNIIENDRWHIRLVLNGGALMMINGLCNCSFRWWCYYCDSDGITVMIKDEEEG